MRVDELMTAEPITIPAEAGVEKAILQMDTSEIRHLLVMENNVLVGVVSDRDLLEATGWHSPAASPRTDHERSTVRDFMHTHPTTIQPDATIMEAAARFVTKRIGCLPVVIDQRLVGIVTERDLLSACTSVQDPDAANPQVSELMTSNPASVEADATLDEVIELCRKARVRHVPILSEGALVGIVSDRDLRRAQGLGRHGETPVEEFMSRAIVKTSPERRVREAARLMNDRVISCLPVTQGNTLLGILTMQDLVYHCMTELSRTEPAA